MEVTKEADSVLSCASGLSRKEARNKPYDPEMAIEHVLGIYQSECSFVRQDREIFWQVHCQYVFGDDGMKCKTIPEGENVVPVGQHLPLLLSAQGSSMISRRFATESEEFPSSAGRLFLGDGCMRLEVQRGTQNTPDIADTSSLSVIIILKSMEILPVSI